MIEDCVSVSKKTSWHAPKFIALRYITVERNVQFDPRDEFTAHVVDVNNIILKKS